MALNFMILLSSPPKGYGYGYRCVQQWGSEPGFVHSGQALYQLTVFPAQNIVGFGGFVFGFLVGLGFLFLETGFLKVTEPWLSWIDL